MSADQTAGRPTDESLYCVSELGADSADQKRISSTLPIIRPPPFFREAFVNRISGSAAEAFSSCAVVASNLIWPSKESIVVTQLFPRVVSNVIFFPSEIIAHPERIRYSLTEKELVTLGGF